MASESTPTNRELRDATLASVLAEAVRDGRLPPTDALRVIKHEMRSRNTNKKERLPYRSVAAQEVLDEYAARGLRVPKNDSPDALHADHVFEFGPSQLAEAVTVEDWVILLRRLRIVVIVTARENYALEQLERSGVFGRMKYLNAGIEWAEGLPPFMIQPTEDAERAE